MKERVCWTLMIFFITLSAAKYYYCPTLSVYNYYGKYLAIGQPNHSIYVTEDYPLLLNSSILVQELKSSSLCVKRTTLVTGETVTLGCINNTTNSRKSHQLIIILGYYMILLTDPYHVSEQYIWWIKGSAVADSVIEKLSSQWKISIRRPTVVIHQFKPHAKDVAIKFVDSKTDIAIKFENSSANNSNKFRNSSADIAIAWLNNGTAYKCYVFNSSFKDVLFLTANASYLSLTISSEFKMYGNYRIKVTYNKDFVSSHPIEVVQYFEASTDHKAKTSTVIVIIVLVLVVIIISLTIAAVLLGCKGLPKYCNNSRLIQIDAQEPKQDAKSIKSKRSTDEKVLIQIDAQEPKQDAKSIKSKRSTDEKVAGRVPSKVTFTDDGEIAKEPTETDAFIESINGEDPEGTDSTPTEPDDLNVLFLRLSQQLTKGEVTELVLLTKIPKRDRAEIENAQQLCIKLQELGQIQRANLTYLVSILGEINRKDLVEVVQGFQRTEESEQAQTCPQDVSS